MKRSDLTKLSTSEILAIYNTHAKTKVKRFADRKSAVRRTMALLEEAQTQKKPQVNPPRTESKAHLKSKSAVLVAPIEKPKKTLEYSSVLKAFEALKLPIGVHKDFRRKLKLDGTREIDGYTFTATYKK